MDKEIKDEWVAALRSGEYKQGQKVLCSREPDGDGERHCCAGVLCEVLVKRGILQKVVCLTPVRVYKYGKWIEETHSLSSKLCQLIKLPEPQLSYGGFTQTIYALNDTYKVPFDKIADLIEAQL